MKMLLRSLAISCFLALMAGTVYAATVEGGGNKRRDCLVQFMTDGVGFPGGADRFKGVTCADGDICDGDGQRDGKCSFLALWCLNQASEALPQCAPPASVESISVSGKVGKGKAGKLDTTAIDQAIADLGLPNDQAVCTVPVAIEVAVIGPDNKGEFKAGRAKLKAKSKTSKGTDKDKYQLTCLPSTGPGVTSTTTTTTLPPVGKPGAGLQAAVIAAAIAVDGTVTVDFTLTDDEGTAIQPVGSSTDDPDEARVRTMIARLEVLDEADGGFTKYVNYITNRVTANGRESDQPTYDSTGTFESLDLATGLWRYTLANMLPADFPANLTHTIGLQIQREFDGEDLVANPIFDFVPDGSPVTTIREVTTTAQCNGCHDPLAIHGGSRREVRLCQLCHTDQAIDPDSGNTIDLKHMIHRIHAGKNAPSIEEGPVGTRYAIIGRSAAVFGEKINVCEGGEYASAPCTVDADCPGGTCTGESTAGVGFPRDIRDCSVCHSDGATVQNAVEKPNTLACTGCHDNRNPGQTDYEFLPAPGTNHAGSRPESACSGCHPSVLGEEFDLSIPGGHTLETRSAALEGLNGEILTAEGAPGGTLTMTFRITDDMGTALTDLSGLNRVAIAASGPNTDFGGSSTPLIRPVVVGNNATGTLIGPDVDGIWTYETAETLPADAEGTWRVGMEGRREVILPDPDGPARDVEEAMQNPVLDFSVDGSEVDPRRTVVDIQNCGDCHGVFSETFSMHGNLRNQTDYCVICHNPNVTDFARRSVAVTDDGASPLNETVHLKYLLHRIHTGEELDESAKPYIVYGFGSAGFTPHDFSEVLFPGDLRNCAKCHVDDSYELPLPSGVLPTALTEVDTSGPTPVEVKTGEIPAIQAACLACHSSDDAAVHAATMTTDAGAEACNVCHREGAEFAVSEVHSESE